MPRPVVLTIAGSDSSCGAGAQADLKTFGALGCHGLTAITCIVAEIPGKVRSIQAVRPEIVRDQLEVLLAAYPVAGIKTGMLYSAPIIRTVAHILARMKVRPPLVIDPVMVASSGDSLLKDGAIRAYRQLLFPMATLITPNLDELGILTGSVPRSLSAMRAAGKQFTAATGTSVLLKGGHLRGSTATDLLLMPDWEEQEFSAPFIRGVETHGTGCTYSAAIVAGLACGLPLSKAIAQAKEFITASIRGAHSWGRITALDQIQQLPAGPARITGKALS
jgi:hydroxymethylpyrimidine/phosphomethylpyrimidine kinase